MRTVDLTYDQLAYLRRVIMRDVAQLQEIARSRAFENYGENESKRIREDIAVGSSLIGILPSVRHENHDQ